MTVSRFRPAALAACLALFALAAPAQSIRKGDHIVAIVNSDIVTALEVSQRIEQARATLRERGQPAPDAASMRQQALDALIDERVLTTYAREAGGKVDEPELTRAINNVAAQNKLTLAQLTERLRTDGLTLAQFRERLRDQILADRVREQEVQQRIKINEIDIDRYLAERAKAAALNPDLNIAQVLVTVPQGATQLQTAERLKRAQQALDRIQRGEEFAKVAREISEDGNREDGGVIGLRPATQLPEEFTNAVRDLQPGQVRPTLLRSPVGFHVLKLVERRQANPSIVQETRARHILLRPSAQLSPDVAAKRLGELRSAILAGKTSFEAAARANSEDGSAPQGGDLGWMPAGSFVPEFEEAMNALPLNGLSEPIASRFGIHLIQVMARRDITLEPKQVREQARASLRESKFNEAYAEWQRELRNRAFIELREP